MHNSIALISICILKLPLISTPTIIAQNKHDKTFEDNLMERNCVDVKPACNLM